MTRLQWLAVVSILLLVLATWSWQSKLFQTGDNAPTSAEHSILPQKVAGPPPPSRQAEFKQMYREPRKVEIPATPEISSACRNLWSELMKADVGLMDTLPPLQNCEPPAELANYQANFREQCLEKKDQKACYTAAFFYRAHITEFLTKDERPDQISDPKVLIDKLFARFLVNPVSAAEIADRLVELQPDYYPASQAAVLSRLFDLFKGDGKPNPDSPEFRRVTDGIEKLSQMNPSDPQNVELQMLLGSIGDNSAERVKDMAESFERQSPHSATSAYYLAWAEYKLGDAEAGARWLARAAQLAPNDPRIKETQEKIKANPYFYKSPNEKDRSVFTATFSFNIQPPQ